MAANVLAVVVGRQKETKKRIEQETGVRIQMLQPAPGSDDGRWMCRITGRCQEDADVAASIIQDLIDNSEVCKVPVCFLYYFILVYV